MPKINMVNVQREQQRAPSENELLQQEAIAQALTEQSMQPANMVGRVGARPELNAAIGMTQLGEALIAARMRKKAQAAREQQQTDLRGSNQQKIEALNGGAYQIDSVDDSPSTPLQTQRLDPETGQPQQNSGYMLDMATQGMDQRQAQQLLSQALFDRAVPKQISPDVKMQYEYLNRQLSNKEGDGDDGYKPLPGVAGGFYKNGKNYLDGKEINASELTKHLSSIAGEKKGAVVANSPSGGTELKPRWAQVEDPNNPGSIIWQDLNEVKRNTAGAGIETATAKLVRERQFSAQGMNDAFDQAEQILTNSEPTGSGIGALMDAGLNFINVNTDSAVAASELDTLGAFLLTKAPKFKGADSEKDRLNYQMQVGYINDRTKPVEQRLSALEKARLTLGKYEKKEQAGPSDDDILNSIIGRK